MTDDVLLKLAVRIRDQVATIRELQLLAAEVIDRLSPVRPPYTLSCVDGGLVMLHGQRTVHGGIERARERADRMKAELMELRAENDRLRGVS